MITSVVDDAGTEVRRIARERIDVREGPNQAAVSIPALSSLAVELEKSTGAEAVHLTALPGGPPVHAESRRVDAEGRAVFDLLPPGGYHLSCQVEGRLYATTVEVPHDASVRLRPLPTGR